MVRCKRRDIMSIPRDIVDLGTLLQTHAGINLFSPGAATAIEKLESSAGLLARIGQKLETSRPELVLLLCLQALKVEEERIAPKLVEAEFVATVPEALVSNARPTNIVVAELIAKARQEIVAVGYEISDGSVITALQVASRRISDLILLCDRARGSGTDILETWPQGCPSPRIYRDRERPNAAKYASMHSKCIIVDGEEMLITSANMTYHGLMGNIEFGVHLKGNPAKIAREVFREIIRSDIIESVG
jgi:hypothetical protein